MERRGHRCEREGRHKRQGWHPAWQPAQQAKSAAQRGKHPVLCVPRSTHPPKPLWPPLPSHHLPASKPAGTHPGSGL